MQPTYLPWLGYFDLIDQSDTFVFLDTVQFARRSWQQRNRIKSSAGPLWLTVPVRSKGMREQSIAQVEIDASAGFQQKHLRTIRHEYGKAVFFAEYFPAIEDVLEKRHGLLSDLNIDLIQRLCELLGIEAAVVRASSLKAEGRLVELLVSLCEAVGADRYLSAAGSREYIENDNLFARRSMDVVYHEYNHPTYRQLHGEFIPYLSVLDLLMNEGPGSLAIIRSGRPGAVA